MQDKVIHPGILLSNMLIENSLSQRELASKIDIAHSLLNNILKGNRNINTNLAISLETAGFKTAHFWLSKQMEHSLQIAKEDEDIIKKNNSIKILNDIGTIVPVSFFRKEGVLDGSPSDDVNTIFEIYDVKNLKNLKKRINDFNPTYFRKSSKFVENKNHVIAWSVLAKYKADKSSIPAFSRSNESQLLKDLKKCFWKHDNVIKTTQKILNSYGIKFLPLNRPSQTPVDGKSFMSGKNPAIVLSLKYNRLDNFAFTLFHELGHVFEHLTNPKRPEFRNEEFFINSSNTVLVEFEADKYASNNLIDSDLFNDFIAFNDEYSDDVILDFSRKNKIHPGIVRGRICHLFNEYYRKRSSITALNKLGFN